MIFLIISGLNDGANIVNNEPFYVLPQNEVSISGFENSIVVSFNSLEPSRASQ